MNQILKTIKPSVRALRAYTLSPHRASVKINQNENPWDAPLAIKEETLRRVGTRKLVPDPDFVSGRLHQHLAEVVGWGADRLISGNGSYELMQALALVTGGGGTRGPSS